MKLRSRNIVYKSKAKPKQKRGGGTIRKSCSKLSYKYCPKPRCGRYKNKCMSGISVQVQKHKMAAGKLHRAKAQARPRRKPCSQLSLGYCNKRKMCYRSNNKCKTGTKVKLTKEMLHKQAQKYNIKGRSTMNKAQLERALIKFQRN